MKKQRRKRGESPPQKGRDKGRRAVELEDDEVRTVDLSQLELDDENANLGTKRGGEAVRRSIETYGMGRGVLSDRNLTLIAGNKTVTKAREAGIRKAKLVRVRPDEVLVGVRDDLTMEKGSATEAKARGLAIMDNQAAILDIKLSPKTVVAQVQRLDLKVPDLGISQSAFKKMQEQANLLENPPDEEADDRTQEGIYALREDAYFPSTNEWGIPDLRPDMLAGAEVIPQRAYGGEKEVPEDAKLFYLYGKVKIDLVRPGSLMGYYLDDENFEDIWFDAVEVVSEFKDFGWGAICSPDFSLWRGEPYAVQLWNIYRSRWCARYWQEAGHKVVPSLNWSDQHTYKWAHGTLPKKIELVSCQCRTTGTAKGKSLFLQGVKAAIDIIQPKHILFYGGDEHQRWIEPELRKTFKAAKTEPHWISSWSSERRKTVLHPDNLNKKRK